MSDQLFRTLAELAPVGIFRTDASGHCLYVNERLCAITGLSVDAAAGFGWTAALHPDDRERVTEEWTQALRGGRPFISEYRFQTAEQKIAWVVGQAQAELDQQGNVVGYVGTVTEITERKQAEEEVKLFRALLDQADDSIEIIDPATGRFLDSNEAAFSSLGYTRDEHRSLTVSDIDPIVTAPIFQQYLTQIRANGPLTLETVHRRKDSSTFPVEVKARLVQLDREYLLAIVRDISKRKRTDAALRASEERYRSLYDETPTMYFTLATDGRLLSVNRFGAGQLGYQVDELVGQSVLDLFHEDDKETVAAGLSECLATPKTTRHWELRKVRKDGGVIWVRETCRVGQSSSGETVILVSCEDITEHKQAEEALQRYEDQIRQMQKMQAIGQLAGGVAHDFNNILTAILGNAEIAYSQIASDHPSRSNLTRILEAGNRASCLVQQILTFSHHRKFSRTVIALSPLVDEALAMLRATLPASVELTNSCNPDTPPTLADATQIHQVLLNLCTNSWHAMEGKPGRIAVSLAPITLTQLLHSPYTALPPGHYACLSVRDTGCGMDPDTVARIFDPFFTTKPAGLGTGLGLSVALGIVQGHDGGIVVNSHPGQGTTISLYFPATKAPVNTNLPVDTTPNQRQKRRCHLLYLDDEEMLVDLVRAKLEPLGYRVTGYTKPTEALAAVGADPDGFDVVVTDYNMPGMSGIEVARALTRLRADLPVVLVSGYLSPETRKAAFDAEIKEIVYKPSMLQQLEEVVARLIDTRPHPSTSTDRVI